MTINDYGNACYIYAITIWDTIDSQPDIDTFFQKIAKLYVYQLEECPSTGTHHYQCFVNLRTKKRCGEVKKMLNSSGFTGAECSIASANGKESLKSYCMKKDSRIAGPWADKPIYLGKDLITQLRPWQRAIVTLAANPNPHPRKIHWFYDAIGGQGKSSVVKTKYDTGVACFNIPHVIVFSNHLPNMSALSKDRWNIIDMCQMCQENLILD